MSKTLEFLQKAIANGDIERAKKLVSDLAQQKAHVLVTEGVETPTAAFEEDIRVKVYIEDKDLSGGHVNMKLKPSMTIRNLKLMMASSRGFPPQIQKWIVAKKIARDEETLQRLRLKDGSSMFLYLLSPKSVGLRKEQFNPRPEDLAYMDMGGVRMPRQSSSGDSVGHTPSPQTLRPEPVYTEPIRTQGQSTQPIPEENVYQAMPDLQTMPQVPPPPPPPMRENQPRLAPQHNPQVGWRCSQCTYFNEPTRPGCEMCGHDRPDDYQVPAQYQPSQREQQRLEAERLAETLSTQSNTQPPPPPQLAEQLDTNETHPPRPNNPPQGRAFAATTTTNNNNNDDNDPDLLRQRLAEDEAFAKALQKEEEEEFERRHRFLQRLGSEENQRSLRPEFIREAFPMQETGSLGEDEEDNMIA